MGSMGKPQGIVFFMVILFALNLFAAQAKSSINRHETISFVPRDAKAIIAKKQSRTVSPEIFDAEDSTLKKISDVARGGGASLPEKEIGGAIYFILVDILLRKVFKENGIDFPSQLAGCIIMLFAMLLLEAIRPGMGDEAFKLLSPGATFLARWLPVFFAPGLVMLPLAPSVGSAVEAAKVILVIIAGFFFTLYTTAMTVLTIRKQRFGITSNVSLTPGQGYSPPVSAYSKDTLQFLATGLCVSAAVSILASLNRYEYERPLRTIFMGFATLFGYVWGAQLPISVLKYVHPLVTCTLVTLLVNLVTAALLSSDFKTVLSTYKTGSMDLKKAGAGDVLLFILGPAVVSFSTAIYSRKAIIAKNLLVVVVAVLVSSLGGLFGTALAVRVLKIAGSTMRLSLLPRNVTTALSLAISNMLGGNISITAATVCLTGIFGATFGGRILTEMGVSDPVSRGLGIGAAAQGLGVASFVRETDAFPFAAIAMILTAVCSTTLASNPAIKNMLKDIALG